MATKIIGSRCVNPRGCTWEDSKWKPRPVICPKCKQQTVVWKNKVIELETKPPHRRTEINWKLVAERLVKNATK